MHFAVFVVNMMILVTLMSATIPLVEATIPIYNDCWRTIHLNEDQPAARLHIDFTGEYSLRECFVQVRKDSTYRDKIGLLLLASPPYKYFPANCHSGPFVLTVDFANRHIQPGFTSNYRKYCPTKFYNLKHDSVEDTGIATQVLNFSWTKSNYESYFRKRFEIVVFLLSLSGTSTCGIDRVSCGGWGSRCIPESIICEHPYKYCGDGTLLCPSTDDTDFNTRGSSHIDSGSLIGIVVGSVAAVLLLLCVCCYCCRGRIKGFRNSGNSNAGTLNDTPRVQITSMQPTTPTSRNQRSSYLQREERSFNFIRENSTGVFIVDDGFIESPPLYISLDTTNDNANVSGNDDLPPSYESVVANARAYKVTDAT